MKHKTEKKSEIRINETDIVELGVPCEMKKQRNIHVNEEDIVVLDVCPDRTEDYKEMDVLEYIITYGIPFEAIEIDM